MQYSDHKGNDSYNDEHNSSNMGGSTNLYDIGPAYHNKMNSIWFKKILVSHRLEI